MGLCNVCWEHKGPLALAALLELDDRSQCWVGSAVTEEFEHPEVEVFRIWVQRHTVKTAGKK